ncbi:MAG: hypothetical protein LC750_09185 [Actinobacteria bacterium]|nr:hypothetical protein [Actinomycetota bacterium]
MPGQQLGVRGRVPAEESFTAPNWTPLGMVEEASATHVRGWVSDTNLNGAATTVKVYVDGSSTPAVTLTANLSRGNPSVNNGFDWTPPSTLNLTNGTQHSFVVKAIDYPSNPSNPEVVISNPLTTFVQMDDSFTGSDNTDWSTVKWNTSGNTLGGTVRDVDILSGQGRFYVANATQDAQAKQATGEPAVLNSEAVMSLRFADPGDSAKMKVALRGASNVSGSWMSDGYQLEMRSYSNLVKVYRVVGTVRTEIGGFTYTFGTATHRLRFKVIGTNPTTVSVKMWPAGTTEPTSWTIPPIVDSTAPVTAPGKLFVSLTNGGGTPRTAYVDDLSLIRLNNTIDDEPNNPAGTAPPNSISRYVDTADPQKLHDAGAEDAAAAFRVMTVLDFGDQNIDGAHWYSLGLSGDTIKSLAKQYIDGFYNAAASGQQVTVALGVSCSGYTGSRADKRQNARDKGAIWAQLVSDVYTTARADHPNTQVRVGGAYDVESEAGFCGPRVSGNPGDGPSTAAAWVAGFDEKQTSISMNGGLPLFYANFGSANGCPPAGSCSDGWTQEDYWSLSTGPRSAVGYPEIYGTSNDEQWQQIGIYGVDQHGDNQDTRIDFVGAMTQRQACLQDRRDNPDHVPADQIQTHYCNGTDQDAPTGWNALKNTLESNQKTAQPVGFSTDIMWLGRAPQLG